MVYHLKTDWEAAKEMIVPERRFLIYRLIEQREREQEEMKKAANAPKYGKRK